MVSEGTKLVTHFRGSSVEVLFAEMWVLNIYKEYLATHKVLLTLKDLDQSPKQSLNENFRSFHSF